MISMWRSASTKCHRFEIFFKVSYFKNYGIKKKKAHEEFENSL